MFDVVDFTTRVIITRIDDLDIFLDYIKSVFPLYVSVVFKRIGTAINLITCSCIF